MDSRKCFGCGKSGHLRKDCPEKPSSKKQNMKCYGCGRHGHIRSECPNLATGKDSPNNSSGGHSSSLYSATADLRFPETSHKFIDTHCHLEYLYDRERHSGSFAAFKSKNPFPASFEGCITMFCDPAAFSTFGSWSEMISEDGVWGAFGCHPHNADYYSDTLEARIIQCLENPKAVAFGEIGLDYSKRSKSQPPKQKEVFIRQLKWAVDLGKPLIIHCREAEADALPILQELVPSDWKIHLHCYTGSVEFAQKFMSHFPNLYIGLTGLVTFSKAKEIHELAYEIPLERLLLETDAPYFVPSKIANNNKWANPGMAIFVAERIAEIKKTSLDQVLEAVRKNTHELYGI